MMARSIVKVYFFLPRLIFRMSLNIIYNSSGQTEQWDRFLWVYWEVVEIDALLIPCVCVLLYTVSLFGNAPTMKLLRVYTVQSYSIPPEPTWKTEGCENGRESTHDFLLYVEVVEEIRVCINTTVLSLISL